MTIIEHAYQEGYQIGLQSGELVGSIRMAQELSGIALTSEKDLFAKSIPELQTILDSLRAQWQQHPRSLTATTVPRIPQNVALQTA